MKIRANRPELADTLAWVAQALSKRPAHAVLGGIRLAATGDILTVRAFDYELSHSATVDVDVASEGECLVSGQFLREIVQAMRGDTVELVLDDSHLTVSAGRSTYRTQVLALQDYPSLPDQPAKVGTVTAEDLQALVAAVKYPIDDASPHPQVRGLHLDGDEDALTAVGARGQIIAEAACSWAGAGLNVTIPSRAFDTAVKGLRGDVVIGVEGGVLGLADEHRSITMRTFEDDYVKWRPLIRPAHQDRFTCEVDVDELRDAVKRTGMLANDETPIVLTFADAELEVSIAGTSSGTEAVAATCEGSLQLGMNQRFLIDALTAIPDGVVSIGLLDVKKPIVLRPVNHPRMVSVIMPRPVPGGAA